MLKTTLSILLLSLATAVGLQAQTTSGATSCLLCHASEDWFGEEGATLVETHAQGIHASVGLSCHDCHGGNPDPALAEDLEAMDEAFEPHPYRGVPDRNEVASFCGACHSDPTYMRQFQAAPRVDQETEYATSQHGLAMAAGRDSAATCTDCHGTHEIRRVGSPESAVYPTHVAETCRGCHENQDLMKDVLLPNGQPLPVDQYARWRRSSHAQALIDREDLSAPTCNDCHGNHGAAPPGVGSVTFVCGRCHGREAELFRKSPKAAGFESHREYLQDAGELGCAACHEEPEPQATFDRSNAFTECTSCHNNHAIVRPTLASLDPLPEVPCVFCHEPAATDARPVVRSVERYEATRDRLVAAARAQGLEGAALYDHLVDEAVVLPEHTLAESAVEEHRLREEFATLFRKFRIGKTTFEYDDPTTGKRVRAPVIRCGDCHGEEPLLASEPAGLTASSTYLEKVVQLTSTAAQAERSLLRARRGGVATGSALGDLDQAIDAQIQLEVLIHSFDFEGDAFSSVQEEGLSAAQRALDGALEALDELVFRRAGLGVALIVILMVLIGLTLKIREISRREAMEHQSQEARRLQDLQPPSE